MSKEGKNKRMFDGMLLWRIIKLASPYKKQFWLAIISTILVAVTAPLRPYLIQLALEDYVAQADKIGLLWITIITIALLVIQTLLQFWNSYITGWIGQSVINDMRNKVFAKINLMKQKFFDKTPVGELVTRCVNDIETIADLFAAGIITITGDILQLIAITGFMFYIDWKLTLITLSVLPLLLYASHIFRIKVKESFQDVRVAVAKINSFVQERITGMQVVQLYNREDIEYEKFKEINMGHYEANQRSVLYYSVFFPVIEIITAISLALLVWWGTKEMLGVGVATFGKLTAFILYINMFFRPVRMLADRFNNVQMGMVAASRVFKLIDNKENLEDSEGSYVAEPIGNIVFDKVWFAYNDENYVIKDLSFTLNEGKTLAIVGETGSGKSSIINLLMKFYPYNKGQITIDGVSLTEWNALFLRKRIAIVMQDVFLFSGSILENITLNMPEISREQVIETSKLLGANTFIEKLPGAYDYKVMERGNTLSMGQRQLISFVRAMVVNPKILVLDEATSSVDSETEDVIQKAIEKMMFNRTSIVIAHRLSTIEKADNIIVMSHGEIVESGTHKELVKQRGRYYQLQKSGTQEILTE
ncbi:MAG: ABC transporter ATP-binding protein/permease [Bacteroidia bacterium]|nr:ABC transporter ATP-binding protein/permease [Bacteroidia bacterium]